LKDRVNKLLVDSGKRVIVFIDDIDRLDREEVHAILKLIKLSASFSNTSYVVSFDDEVVAASLGERYGSGEAQGGRQFLEKIIQVPLHLPDAEGVDLRIICFEGVDAVLSQNGVELTEDDAEAFVRYFTDGIMPGLRTPRQAKRYVNAIRFAVPLLKGEVHLGDLLLIEALRSTYARLYLTVRDNLDVFTGVRLLRSYGDPAVVKEEAKGVVEAGLAGLTASEREGAIDLLKALFPRLNAIFGNTSYGSDWDKYWDAAKRITSGDYFRRYFQYSVPARDVPDSLVSEALRAAKAADSAAVDAFCETVSQRNAWGRCLDKLLARLDELDESGRRIVALAVARHAAKIPNERGMFASIMSSANRAAGLVSALVKRITDQDIRLASAVDVMEHAATLPFGAECLRWLRKGKGNSTGLEEVEIGEVGAVLARRIAKDFGDAPDYAKHGRSIGTLLWIWKAFGGDGEMTAYLTGRSSDTRLCIQEPAPCSCALRSTSVRFRAPSVPSSPTYRGSAGAARRFRC
jgi:hypothetical protein